MQKFAVEVEVMPTPRSPWDTPEAKGQRRRIEVQAKNQAEAIVKANLALDDEGIDCWTLVRVTSLLN
jgi:ribosomal protein S6E (S10)